MWTLHAEEGKIIEEGIGEHIEVVGDFSNSAGNRCSKVEEMDGLGNQPMMMLNVRINNSEQYEFSSTFRSCC